MDEISDMRQKIHKDVIDFKLMIFKASYVPLRGLLAVVIYIMCIFVFIHLLVYSSSIHSTLLSLSTYFY